MEKVNVWKCDFCKRTSFNKGSIRKHEKKCFYNPETKSCATCLWFSPLHGIGPLKCFKEGLKETNEGSKQKLETQCDKWIDLETIDEIDIWDEQCKEALNLLLNGSEEIIPVLGKLNAQLSDL